MGWLSEDNLHEGYLVPQFADGQRGRGTTGGNVPDDEIVVGPEVEQPDGAWVHPTRPAGEVSGWVVCCDCYRESGFDAPSTWVGPVFARVPSAALQDLAARKVYAADEGVAYVGDADTVDAAARDLWMSEHVFGLDALSEVEAATSAVESARQRLDTAVLMARSSGASWAAVGRATGMTRQSARERWGHTAGR
ncbi:hypothetical protein [Microlunatus sp. Y2014]|uniref:hypothetical protein n=1 Tax=Microlunatus sp. Y2014 TaxID=3418488 RepID=UPI003DA74D58